MRAQSRPPAGPLRRALRRVRRVSRYIIGWPGAWALGGMVAVGVWLAGSAGPADPTLGPTVEPPATVTYLSLGGAETLGAGVEDFLRDAYPQVFFREELPNRTVFVNLGSDEALVGEIVPEHEALLAELRPDIVTVFVGLDDAAVLTPVEEFAAGYEAMVVALRAFGDVEILAATMPAIAGLEPAVLEPYNAVIRDVTFRYGVTLVDLGVQLGIDANPALTTADDELSVVGHTAVAELFGAYASELADR